MKVVKVYDGTDPGGTPGRVFTASIGQEEITQDGAFLSWLMVGLKHAVATAAVVIETSVGLLSEYMLRIGSETRILMNMRQLCALMAFYFKELPFIWENTDATGNNFVGGVKVPIFAKMDATKKVSHSAAWVTQTNAATTTLAIDAYFDETDQGKKPVHAVAVSLTSAAATGYQLIDVILPQIGKLVGVIIQHATPFADGTIAVSIERLRLLINGQTHSQFNVLASSLGVPGVYNGTLEPIADLLNVFSFLDLRPSGLDLKTQEVKISIDVQDVSDAIVIIPVIEIG